MSSYLLQHDIINIRQMNGNKGYKEIDYMIFQDLTVKFKKNYAYQIWIHIKFKKKKTF